MITASAQKRNTTSDRKLYDHRRERHLSPACRGSAYRDVSERVYDVRRPRERSRPTGQNAEELPPNLPPRRRVRPVAVDLRREDAPLKVVVPPSLLTRTPARLLRAENIKAIKNIQKCDLFLLENTHLIPIFLHIK